MKARLFTFLILILSQIGAYGQNSGLDTIPAYKRSPNFPAFNIMLSDSSTIFNTYNIPSGRPSMLVCFSPDCSHCQAFFKKFLPAMDSFKNVDIYLVTPSHQFTAIRKFMEDYHLVDYKNIKQVGRDYEFFCFTFYNVRAVPDIAIYDKKKKFVKFLEKEFTNEEIYSITSKL